MKRCAHIGCDEQTLDKHELCPLCAGSAEPDGSCGYCGGTPELRSAAGALFVGYAARVERELAAFRRRALRGGRSAPARSELVDWQLQLLRQSGDCCAQLALLCCCAINRRCEWCDIRESVERVTRNPVRWSSQQHLQIVKAAIETMQHFAAQGQQRARGDA